MRYFTQRLGLGIGRDRVTAVLLRGQRVAWAASLARESAAPLGNSLGLLLEGRPRRLLPTAVTAAFGPSVSQLKCLTQLPPLADARSLAAIVQENVGRFFMKNGVPLMVSGAYIEAPNRVWVAAFETPVVEEVAGACRNAGLVLRHIVPSAIALRHTTSEKEIAWIDGEVRLELVYDTAGLISIRRVPAECAAVSPPKAIAHLAALANKREALDAAGAALTNKRDPAVIPTSRAFQPPTSMRRRLASAGAVCASAVTIALASPGISAAVVLHRSHAREAAILARASVAERNATELSATSTAIRALADFAGSRQLTTELLARVTRGLPDSATLVAFQVDSAGLGSVVAVAPHAAAVVDAVERIPMLASPQIIGPVTRETVGGRNLERVTVQFRLLPATSP